jgi:hypothetical protein
MIIRREPPPGNAPICEFTGYEVSLIAHDDLLYGLERYDLEYTKRINRIAKKIINSPESHVDIKGNGWTGGRTIEPEDTLQAVVATLERADVGAQIYLCQAGTEITKFMGLSIRSFVEFQRVEILSKNGKFVEAISRVDETVAELIAETPF